MPEYDKYCWVCHRDHASLPCKECFRNYHYRCARNIMADDSLFEPDPNNRKLYQFKTTCSDCQALAQAAKSWEKGLEFQKISRETLNTLLLYILDLLKQSAPAPFLWPASKLSLSGCPFTMDFTKIKQKANANLYSSSREFLNDITLINHNCAIIVKCENRNREMRALSKELCTYKNEMLEFKKTAEMRIRYLEDCPHCILNFEKYEDTWLTKTCPWGHLLILAKVDESLWPAKLIRFNRSSGRLDVILFGTGERIFPDNCRVRINESSCWIPSRSDLDIYQKKQDLKVAYEQARQYAATLRKKFGRKFALPQLRRRISAIDKDYISKGPTSDEEVINLTDDEQEEHNASSESGSKVSRIGAKKQSPIDENANSEANTNIKDDSSESAEKNKDDNICDVNNNANKTSKDKVCDAEPNPKPDNVKDSLNNSSDNVPSDIPINGCIDGHNGVPDLMNGMTDNIPNDSASLTTVTENEKDTPMEYSSEEPEVSSTQFLSEDNDTLRSDQYTQFEVESDDDSEGNKITSISNEVEENIKSKTGDECVFSPDAANFVIEDETNDDSKAKISENHFTLSLDEQSKETVFESTIMTDLSGSCLNSFALDQPDHSTVKAELKSLCDDYEDGLSGPVFKKMKYYFFKESHKVKERLEAAEKEFVQLKMAEEYHEAIAKAKVEAEKAKSLEEICEKIQKELQELSDKYKEDHEELVKKSNSLVELQQTVDKLREEREELLKKANQLPELNETVDKLTKDRQELNKKIDNLVEEHRSALINQEKELNSTWQDSLAQQLKTLESKQDQTINELNKSWEEKYELCKLSHDLKYKKLKNKFLKLHLTIKASLASTSDSDDDSESPLSNQGQSENQATSDN